MKKPPARSLLVKSDLSVPSLDCPGRSNIRTGHEDERAKTATLGDLDAQINRAQSRSRAFNSLDAQREACEAYIKSQAHEGWRLSLEHYDDGGLSGASLERPAGTGMGPAPHFCDEMGILYRAAQFLSNQINLHQNGPIL
jgi:hypothetical protein